jgi:hypothetical protein
MHWFLVVSQVWSAAQFEAWVQYPWMFSQRFTLSWQNWPVAHWELALQ